MTIEKGPFERAMCLAALSGLKVSLGPAFHQTARRKPHASRWVIAALGEMFLDKVGILPPRYKLPLLIPRAAAGAWVAHESMKDEGCEDSWAAPMGAVVAAGVGCIAPILRMTGGRTLGVPDLVIGLVEDYFALRLGTEATGLTFKQMAESAHEAIDEAADVAVPALHSVGIG